MLASYAVLATIETGMNLNSIIDVQAFYVEFLSLTSDSFILNAKRQRNINSSKHL